MNQVTPIEIPVLVPADISTGTLVTAALAGKIDPLLARACKPRIASYVSSANACKDPAAAVVAVTVSGSTITLTITEPTVGFAALDEFIVKFNPCLTPPVTGVGSTP